MLPPRLVAHLLAFGLLVAAVPAQAGFKCPAKGGSEWREGQTLAYLVDFLDSDTGRPRFRLYYQDAPANAPVSQVHPSILAEKRVDVALLCVGTFDQVNDHPGAIITALNPRYVVAGHWESFFQPQSDPTPPLPFLNVGLFASRMAALLSASPEAPARVNGGKDEHRGWMPDPETRFEFSAE